MEISFRKNRLAYIAGGNRLMTRTIKIRVSLAAKSVLLSIAGFFAASLLQAQAPLRFVGSITAISGTTLTVKTDTDGQRQVDVPSEASVKRIAPGQKDLSTAATITFSELAVGDRVLVKLDPNATGATPQAAQIIAVKQEDLAQKQQREKEQWQRGPHGLVKSVDSASGAIVVTTGAGATAKPVAIHVTKATVLRRYAPGSVRFEQAQPAPIDSIHVGDQLQARGTASPDGNEITADEVVSGTFLNISGTITSLDAGTSTLVVKDLATKKQMTIHVPEDAQMRRLPDRMAQGIAMFLKGNAAGAQGRSSGSGGSGQSSAGAPPQHAATGAPGGGAGAAQSGAAGGPGAGMRGGDPQQFLSRAPAIKLGDLTKGEAVMLVATQGAADVTAVSLFAGVEPLLQAPASQSLLSNWSMGSGGAEGASAQ